MIYIAHVGIREAWRGHGVGTKLFVAIEDWARAQGAWRLDLRVDEENARGLALYHKRGSLTQDMLGMILLLVLVSAWITESLGIHALFGAFLAGVVMPKDHEFAQALLGKLEDIAIVLLAR